MDRIVRIARLVWTTALWRRFRASFGALALERCVIDEITRSFAGVSFKGVQQAEPVSRFMYRCFALVEAVHDTFWHGVCVNIATVVGIDGGIGVFAHVRWKCAASKYPTSKIGLEVDVERSISTDRKSVV